MSKTAASTSSHAKAAPSSAPAVSLKPRSPAPTAEPAAEQSLSPTQSRAVSNLTGGSAMNPADRHFFEQRMGQDFSGVRLHTGSQAAKAADSIGARAFTHGGNIAFNSGEYQPGTQSGRRLLAHELTHVVQQRGKQGVVNRMPKPLPPGERDRDDRVPNANLDLHWLVYAVMCWLGISPGPVTTWIDELMKAVWDEYLEHHGDIKLARQAFARTKAIADTLNGFSILGFWLHFLLTGKLDLFPGIEVPLRARRVTALRTAALGAIARAGVKVSKLRVASRILGKVGLAIDVAFAIGCGAYAGLRSLAIEGTRILKIAIQGALQIGRLVAMMFIAPFVLLAHGAARERHRLSILNTDFSSLADVKGAQIRATGLIATLGDAAFKDAGALARPVGRVPGTRAIIPQFSADVDTANSLQAPNSVLLGKRTRFLTLAPPRAQYGMKVRDYSRHLERGRILKYRHDPEQLAAEEINSVIRGG